MIELQGPEKSVGHVAEASAVQRSKTLPHTDDLTIFPECTQSRDPDEALVMFFGSVHGLKLRQECYLGVNGTGIRGGRDGYVDDAGPKCVALWQT